MRCGHAKRLQNRGERIEAPGQLGEAMLHEAVPDDQTQRDRGPAGDRRSADQVDRDVAPTRRPILDVAHRFHTQTPCPFYRRPPADLQEVSGWPLTARRNDVTLS